ncbi:MAG TPA: hypothetical protein PLO62_13520 [Candidatus Hydrogenedentes bacterium]|nr:hypothetical protein [Candidatus Hydrogenedentota bacterium]
MKHLRAATKKSPCLPKPASWLSQKARDTRDAVRDDYYSKRDFFTRD